jgi:hypothetical protein
MNIEQTKLAVVLCRNANIPAFLWGPGGVGKTSSMFQLSKELNINFIPITAPLLQPVDILGLPDREDRRTIWLRPELFPTKGSGIILIDEIPDATMLMQKAFYSLILEHRIQSHIIPDSWYICGAGNRPEDKSFSSVIPSPLITRFAHIGVCCNCPDFTESTVKSADMDVEDFIKYSLVNFHPLISAYLKFRPEHIYRNQAVPRTWEYVSRLLNSIPNIFIDKQIEFVSGELVKGTVGHEIGREFIRFINLATKIPSIDLIIKDPINTVIPEQKDIQYAVVTALLRLLKEDNDTNIIKYIKRLSNEMQFFFFNMAKKTKPFIINNIEFINWFNLNKEMIL